MKVEVLVLGSLETNCYLIFNHNDVVIVDPADESEKIINYLSGNNVVGILVTHHHFDHVGALEKLESYYNLKHNPATIKGFNYEIIKTPGHTDDSISFYFKKEKLLFCGDFIFYNSIGRYDFPNSSKIDMIESLEKIFSYDDDIIVFPGHGISTILGDEKKRFRYYF